MFPELSATLPSPSPLCLVTATGFLLRPVCSGFVELLELALSWSGFNELLGLAFSCSGLVELLGAACSGLGAFTTEPAVPAAVLLALLSALVEGFSLFTELSALTELVTLVVGVVLKSLFCDLV
jgi:hypothetical protein